ELDVNGTIIGTVVNAPTVIGNTVDVGGYGDTYFTRSGANSLRVTGNVGIGVDVSSNASLEVDGAMVSTPDTVASGATVNLKNSNTHVLNSVGGSTITLQNPVHGGQYTIVVRDTTISTNGFTYYNSYQ